MNLNKLHAYSFYKYRHTNKGDIICVYSAKTVIDSAIQIWNGLPGTVVGEICNNGAQSFRSHVHHHLMSTVADGAITPFLAAVNH